jgi:hypothetical protein
MGWRFVGAVDNDEAHAGLNRWVGMFAAACIRAVDDAMAFEAVCSGLEEAWRKRLGIVRAGSSVDLLVGMLAGTPVLSVGGAMEAIGRSKPQVNAAMSRLEAAGILTQVTAGRRNRVFEASEVIDAFTDLERRLASPAGDTRVASPARPVPRRSRARRGTQ